MNLRILLPLVLILTAGCAHNAPSRNPASSNCDQLYADNSKDLKGLRKVYEDYLNLSWEIAQHLFPPLKQMVEKMNAKIMADKQQCWANERRTLDFEAAALKSEIDRLLLKEEYKNLQNEIDGIR